MMIPVGVHEFVSRSLTATTILFVIKPLVFIFLFGRMGVMFVTW